MPVRFDDSLPFACKYILDCFGEELLSSCIFIRDASGRLSVLIPSELDDNKLSNASSALHVELGGYGRGNATIRDIRFPGVNEMFRDMAAPASMIINGSKIRVLDRRIIGADWNGVELDEAGSKLPRVVFASLKGGVGRSTALAIVAAHLSAQGKRVLAIDLDLEAPGIGATLLKDKETPEYGVLDYLVENGLSPIDESFLQQCIGSSSLGSRGARVDVMPALGQRTLNNPSNTLAKLGRVYIEDVSEEGKRITFSEQVSLLLKACENTSRYDIILIDARSGLHESNAAILQNIDANVLLFASDQPQTYVGYKLLLSHFSDVYTSVDGWFDRFHFVHAKSSHDEERQHRTEEKLLFLFESYVKNPESRNGYLLHEKALPKSNLTADDFEVEWESDDGALGDDLNVDIVEYPEVLRILDDPRFEGFDPLVRTEMLSPEVYQNTFNSVLIFFDSLFVQDEN